MIDTYSEASRDQVVFHEPDQSWYKLGDEPWRVVFLSKGQEVLPKPKAKADTYAQAFEALFGHPMFIPPVTRAARREVIA